MSGEEKISKEMALEKRVKRAYITSMAIIIVLILVSFVYCNVDGYDRLSARHIRDVSINITGMLIGGVLIFSLAHDKPWDAQNRSLFRLLFTLCFLQFLDVISTFLRDQPIASPVAVRITGTFMIFNETLLIYCFWTYIREELELEARKAKVVNIICQTALILDLILDCLNMKFEYFFTVNADGKYAPGVYVDLIQITSLIIYLTAWIVIIKEKKHTLKEKCILVTFLIFPAIASASGVVTRDLSLVFPTYLISAMLIYINVFAARSKKIAEQKVVMEQQSTALMISQIQPHFIYNVLTTISNLCVTDPEEAEETTVLFSQYLRTNLDSINHSEPVQFSVELGHINTYVELEKKRFGEKLNVEYDIKERNFRVPSLGLQPIVENSIKHGIRGKETPGHLKISSRKVPNGYEVVIEDDGVGFDTNNPYPNDGRNHVGMINVRTRLEQMSRATMTIESSPGNGCKTTIVFPEE